MNKNKRKALQVTALLGAVSGATLVMSAGTPAQAREVRPMEERCWDQQPPGVTQYRLHNCGYVQYGIKKGEGGDTRGENPPVSIDPPGGPSGGGDYGA